MNNSRLGWRIRYAVVFFSILVFGGVAQAESENLFSEHTPALGAEEVEASPDFSLLAKYARRAVVNISSETGAGDGNEADEEKEEEGGLSPFLKRNSEPPSRSLGSGFFVSETGYIVTNNHVIANGGKIVVRIPDDKTEYQAELVGADSKTDIALIKITPPSSVVALPLGNSDSLEIGEWVMAVGNQFQLGQTFTAGIVSAKSRRVPVRSSGPYDQFIQTDAAINPGSSGGPLLNTKGQVVGINTAIFSPGRQGFGAPAAGFNIGIGFSVPVNLAKGILLQLKDKGRVTRGLLGVIIQPVTLDVQEALALSEARGALVADVLEDTPAEEVGFQREDVILSFNGNQIDEHDDLPLMVANTPVGTTVKVGVVREGKQIELRPTVGELKDSPEEEKEKGNELKPDKIGLIIEELTPRYSRQMGQDKPEGIVIAQVAPSSAGEKAGLQRGDILLEFNRRPVLSPSEYNKLLDDVTKDQVVLLLIARREGTRFLTLRNNK